MKEQLNYEERSLTPKAQAHQALEFVTLDEPSTDEQSITA